ncbi:hypothetical protein P9112_012644 [Eukaryota sp. TZLM1-RC]
MTSNYKQLKDEANMLFKSNDLDNALDLYKKSLQHLDCCPQEPSDDSNFPTYIPEHAPLAAIVHNNMSLCYLKQNQYNEALKHSSVAIRDDAAKPKALYRQGMALAGLERYREAVTSLTEHKSLMAESNVDSLISRFETLAQEQEERQKKEAIDKLKDLGSSILGKFGLSLDNFKLQQDSQGGYSVQFQK